MKELLTTETSSVHLIKYNSSRKTLWYWKFEKGKRKIFTKNVDQDECTGAFSYTFML